MFCVEILNDMSIRFRKRIKVIPGVYLNVSKSGVSASIGPKGTNVNISQKGSYLNLGIPGTGISHRQKISSGQTPSPMPGSGVSTIPIPQQTASPVQNDPFYDKAKNIRVNITNPNLETIKTSIEDSRVELLDILREGEEATKSLKDLKEKLKSKSIWINKLFSSKATVRQIEEDIQDYENYFEELQKQYDEAKVNITISSDSEISQQYEKLRIAYLDLSGSSRIWDITSKERSIEHKSSASNIVDRKAVKFSYADLEFINTEAAPFYLENVDGDHIYIYPGFILQIAQFGDITITDFSDFQFLFYKQRFLEEQGSLPPDAAVIDHTWAKVNKDGSPDRRFAGNYQIPVVNYGALEFKFFNHVTESYYVSNVALAEKFAEEFEAYLSFFKDSYKQENISINNINPFQFNDIQENNLNLDLSKRDYLFEDAARLIVMHQQGSISLIQRKLKLGYNRAGRIMNQLEALGIVEPISEGKARQVLFYDEYSLEQYLVKLRQGDFIPGHMPDNQEHHDLSDQYLELLKDIAWKMIGLKNNLLADKKLNENVGRKAIGSGNDALTMILSFLLHDLNDVFKRINPEKDHLKTYGTFFILNELLNSKKSKLSLSNEEIRSNYKYINKSEIFDIIINAGSSANSFNFTFDKEKYDFKLKTTLILTPLLKSNEIIVLEEYKKTLHSFTLVLAKMDRQITVQEEEVLKELFTELSDPYEIIEKEVKIFKTESNNFDNALDELNSLVGLHDIKEELKKLANFIRVQKAREESGLKSTPISYHMVFSGNPGTGKTTVARIVSKIYKQLGILSEGHLVETDRSGLVAEYIGQTATKVNNVVDAALNGVLFIDEAYALVTEGNNDYGKEAVATLIKRIEDDRDKLVVIFAGYSEEMNKFLEMNPGFQSRINRFLDFKDYSDQELKEIFVSQCEKLDYYLTPDALTVLSEKLEIAIANKDEFFGNARYVRNLFEKTLEQHANRIASEGNLTKESLTTITHRDIA